MKTVQHNFKKIIVILAVLVGINIAGHFIFKRFDLTADKRYTLSETSLQIVDEITEPVYIDVFLEGKADAALAASVFHFGEIKIPDLKSYLCAQGISVRKVER